MTEGQQKAYDAGLIDSSGAGGNRQHEFPLKDRPAYNKGFREGQKFQEAEAEQEAFDHPLRQISRDANAIWHRADDSDVCELARLIEALADHLAEQEQSR
jgi:hypothetical protein